MKKMFLLFILLLIVSACTKPESVMQTTITIASEFSVNQTANRFEDILSKKGLTQFARVYHSESAKKVDLELRPTELVIFGNPKVGTPLMQCSQLVALDLPQKALFWEDEAGKVWVTYNNPEYLKTRHDIKGCDEVLGKISNVLAALTKAAATQDQ